MAVLSMKKINICAMKKDRKAVLEELQSLGAVEIQTDGVEDDVFKKMNTYHHPCCPGNDPRDHNLSPAFSSPFQSMKVSSIFSLFLFRPLSFHVFPPFLLQLTVYIHKPPHQGFKLLFTYFLVLKLICDQFLKFIPAVLTFSLLQTIQFLVPIPVL